MVNSPPIGGQQQQSGSSYHHQIIGGPNSHPHQMPPVLEIKKKVF